MRELHVGGDFSNTSLRQLGSEGNGRLRNGTDHELLDGEQRNNIILGSNALLNDVAQELRDGTLDWDSLIEETQKTSAYKAAQKTGNVDKYITDGLLCEVYVGQVLRDCSEDWGGITLDLPLANFTQTDKYNFYKQHGSIDSWSVADKATGYQVTEYDHIAIINGETEAEPDVLCIFEVKMARHFTGAFSKRHINKIFTPLKELYQEFEQLPKQFGYAVVVPKNLGQRPTDMNEFKEMGGLYIPLPIDRETFHQKAEETRNTLSSNRLQS